MTELSHRPDDGEFNELKILPPAWRKPVGTFWAAHGNFLPSAVPLVTKLMIWKQSEGLTIEILRPVLERLCRPSASFQFANQLLAALADGVNDALLLSRPPKRAADNPAIANPPVPVPMFRKKEAS